MLQVPHDAIPHTVLDWILTGLLAIISILGGIVAWLFKAKMDVYEAHIEESKKDHEDLVRLKAQADSWELETLKKTMLWLGDCILIIGQSQGVDLPPRP